MVTITLSGPAKNALGTTLMRQVRDQVVEAGGEPLLITGSGDAFSAGLDLKEVYAADLEQMRGFQQALEQLIEALYFYPGPTAAAVNGHAIAGGAIVALVCDRRVCTTESKARLGLNEVALGLRFPPRLLALIRRCLPAHLESEILLGADLHGPEDALRLGLVDALAEDPVAAATAWLQRVGSFPEGAYAGAKAQLRPPVEISEADARFFEHEVLPTWTSSQVKALIGRFLGKA